MRLLPAGTKLEAGVIVCSGRLAAGKEHKTAAIADAQQFLDGASHGRETFEGEVGVYSYREVKAEATDTFALESLLPGTGYDVHVSKLKV
jgi:hypothetical protein